MDPKQIVRDGYDKVSYAYHSGATGAYNPNYAAWVGRLFVHEMPEQPRILELGCGCGIPVARLLARRGRVTGVDISPVQIARARELVAGAEFICADMSSFDYCPNSFDAVVAFYAIIHLPLEEQPTLFQRIASCLTSGGILVATLGSGTWTGTEQNWLGVEGAEMYWSHADAATYRRWLTSSGFEIISDEYVPDMEHDIGHQLFYARRGT